MSRQYCVVSNNTGRMVEGGFFRLEAAEESAREWTRETRAIHHAEHQRDFEHGGRRADAPKANA